MAVDKYGPPMAYTPSSRMQPGLSQTEWAELGQSAFFEAVVVMCNAYYNGTQPDITVVDFFTQTHYRGLEQNLIKVYSKNVYNILGPDLSNPPIQGAEEAVKYVTKCREAWKAVMNWAASDTTSSSLKSVIMRKWRSHLNPRPSLDYAHKLIAALKLSGEQVQKMLQLYEDHAGQQTRLEQKQAHILAKFKEESDIADIIVGATTPEDTDALLRASKFSTQWQAALDEAGVNVRRIPIDAVALMSPWQEAMLLSVSYEQDCWADSILCLRMVLGQARPLEAAAAGPSHS